MRSLAKKKERRAYESGSFYSILAYELGNKTVKYILNN